MDNGDKYTDLSFETFKNFAKDKSLSSSERVGFPNQYREGKEFLIFRDILSKLTNLNKKRKYFLDIGPGASSLTNIIIDFCRKKNHNLVFVDSKEMLDLVDDQSNLKKIESCFPQKFEEILNEGPYDAILTYSVFQYPFVEGNSWDFIDKMCLLLNNGGQLLIGDIPNFSMRKRFLASDSGVNFHNNYNGNASYPDVKFNTLDVNKIDDGVILGTLFRLRSSGFHAFVIPQKDDLPMANRREDILVIKP